MSDWTPGLISLLVPTRGRPERCAAMWRSARETASEPQNIELVMYIDEDDPRLLHYQLDVLGPRIFHTVGRRIVLSEMWNRCLDLAHGELLWHGNDDVLFRSSGWDSSIRGAFMDVPDKILLAHGRDGIHDGGSATLGFLHRRWVEVVGYFVPPYFASDYNDTWLTEVANILGRRRFLPQVYTEHMHPVAGKGPWDQTHMERMERHRQTGVDQLYASLDGERRAWAERLRTAMTS